ncbi:MAG TPA: rhamnulokinase [Candidatus Eisenbergiella merdipullorum]|uniref:Rhamnulokinase n=1 Tax=Candidatus Eisenbergiella merdipullorum TaxID=2838553 RepID=A0A9D2I5Q3_9FIRM|nr:rhamnulokinase [Candidatus Eisenbergiella merdipullorum]
MAEYYLAVDIGASSGRHILGHVEEGKIVLEEVYRFENGMEKKDGHLCWNIPHLFHEIKEGLKACRAAGKIPKSMGIDTWAVDHVLLDGNDQILGKTYGYRDWRTKGMDEEVYSIIPEKELYARTGIQKQMFNTIYQLMAVKKQEPENMEKAERLLMLPDYFHFLLTGNKLSEYTNATSTQLVSPETKQWDYELIERLGFKSSIFKPLHMPGTTVGCFTKEVADEVGFSCQVVLPATHDTASAVISVPALTKDCLYISSGTWSLMGIENDRAICTEESRKRNFTNEGGYEYRFRYLKNIMGLWMIQSARHEWNDVYSFAQLCDMAEEENAFPSRVDVNDDVFLAPDSMLEAIRDYCRKAGEAVPETVGQTAAVIYQSLAESYAQTVSEIEELTGRHFPAINIVGGGSNAAYLNQLTADSSGRNVYAGPGEATAIGNLAVQMIQDGQFDSLEAIRRCIYDSFGVKEYTPKTGTGAS